MVGLKEIDDIRGSGYWPNVVALIVSVEGRVLLCRKEKWQIWEFPQGGIENGETLELALGRETKEELGIELSAVEMVFAKHPLMQNLITFPPQTQVSRELLTDDGQLVVMQGKYYYFCVMHLITEREQQKFIQSNSEYDELRWVNHQEGISLNSTNKQKGERRVIQGALDALEEKGLIK